MYKYVGLYKNVQVQQLVRKCTNTCPLPLRPEKGPIMNAKQRRKATRICDLLLCGEEGSSTASWALGSQAACGDYQLERAGVRRAVRIPATGPPKGSSSRFTSRDG